MEPIQPILQSPPQIHLNRQYKNSYFEERKISEEVFNEFYLGTCAGCADSVILPPGIFDSPTFPVYNINGDLKGYGFRPGTDYCKYLIFGFKKREQLYGINFAMGSILEKNKVYIVEGYFDVLAAFSKGIRNVVSIFGNTISTSQAYTLASLTDNFVFMLDSDTSGINGSTKSEKLVKKILPNVNVSSVLLYPYKDLNEKLMSIGEEDVRRL